MLMLTDGRQPIDNPDRSSDNAGPFLAIEPEGRDWDEETEEERHQREWEGSTERDGAFRSNRKTAPRRNSKGL
jgi:hypothetical protein